VQKSEDNKTPLFYVSTRSGVQGSRWLGVCAVDVTEDLGHELYVCTLTLTAPEFVYGVSFGGGGKSDKSGRKKRGKKTDASGELNLSAYVDERRMLVVCMRPHSDGVLQATGRVV
jgi:hypothetical protein